jgi:extracellular factor (EF) 3-hydroxypalmitic acid methyl ester biosynthesis protein
VVFQAVQTSSEQETRQGNAGDLAEEEGLFRKKNARASGQGGTQGWSSALQPKYLAGPFLGLVLGTIIAETRPSMPETSTPLRSDADLRGPPDTVAFKTSLGFRVQANVLRFTPQSVTFEVLAPETVLRLSERLGDFEILADTQSVYSGQALVTAIMNTGTGMTCEAALSAPLVGLKVPELVGPEKAYLNGFGAFLRRWHKCYKVDAEYKVIIADLQTFLSSLRLWLDQVELTIQASPAADRARLELDVGSGLRPQVSSALSNLFERFEEVAEKIEPEWVPAHRAFGQRQLHAYLLCAPFIYRTYIKPLGYAGDYEMMNMIVRNGLEGSSLYAKLANAYLLDQVGPQAVRNRVAYLYGKLTEETARIARLGRSASIYNIACGPAREAADFVANESLADGAQFHLLDFNAETLDYASAKMEEARKTHNRRTTVSLVKKSVSQMLKANVKSVAAEQRHDLIYCSGLYDYLNDRVVKMLNSYLYDQLQPGGLLVVGNFAPNLPVRNFIEHFLEWFLIYRNARQLAALAPEQASPADCRVVAEPTGTNVFLEVRKPL